MNAFQAGADGRNVDAAPDAPTPLSDLPEFAQGGLPAARIGRLLADLVAALAPLHAGWRVHGGIALQSVGVDGDGRAQLLAEPARMGDSADCVPGYAAFEQYTDDPQHPCGPWTDVYALSALGYALATGEAPPPALQRCVRDEYVPLARRLPAPADAEFAQAIDAGLAMDHRLRPGTLELLRQRLGAVATPTVSAPSSPVEPVAPAAISAPSPSAPVVVPPTSAPAPASSPTPSPAMSPTPVPSVMAAQTDGSSVAAPMGTPAVAAVSPSASQPAEASPSSPAPVVPARSDGRAAAAPKPLPDTIPESILKPGLRAAAGASSSLEPSNGSSGSPLPDDQDAVTAIASEPAGMAPDSSRVPPAQPTVAAPTGAQAAVEGAAAVAAAAVAARPAESSAVAEPPKAANPAVAAPASHTDAATSAATDAATEEIPAQATADLTKLAQRSSSSPSRAARVMLLAALLVIVCAVFFWMNMKGDNPPAMRADNGATSSPAAPGQATPSAQATPPVPATPPQTRPPQPPELSSLQPPPKDGSASRPDDAVTLSSGTHDTAMGTVAGTQAGDSPQAGAGEPGADHADNGATASSGMGMGAGGTSASAPSDPAVAPQASATQPEVLAGQSSPETASGAAHDADTGATSDPAAGDVPATGGATTPSVPAGAPSTQGPVTASSATDLPGSVDVAGALAVVGDTPVPPTPPKPTSATVNLNISPWGEVWVDGKSRGVSPPLRQLSLPLGKHTITVRNPASQDYQVSVDLNDSRGASVSHRFE